MFTKEISYGKKAIEPLYFNTLLYSEMTAANGDENCKNVEFYMQ